MTAFFFSGWVTGRLMKPLANTLNTESKTSFRVVEKDWDIFESMENSGHPS